ncbi:halocin C8-like domain-containing protein [Halorhabdus rudnickae]|uniref:halocin C8-like domain-containing protein n=1 Tax=Halorhabdus rudnickae TaxID=1775544 RepID=UPI003743AAB6
MKATISSDGFSPKKERTMTADLDTKNKRWNERDPRLVVLPFWPSDGSTSKQNRTNLPRGGALLFSIVADDENGDRRLASTLGFGTAPSSSISSMTTGRSVGIYGNDPNTGRSVETHENSSNTAFSAERIDVQNVSSINTAGMSCDSCKVITNAVCDAGGLGATMATCNKLGVACLSGGPWGAFGCWAACASLMGTISLFGCYYGTQEICDKVGFC